MPHASKNNWIQTCGSRVFRLSEPRAEDVAIEEIAHSLSLQCRFTGHTRLHYSVAEHSVHCSEIVEPAFALDGLLHDASEAYLGDVSSPLKRELGAAWDAVEERIERVITEAFGLLYPHPRAVIHADKIMLGIECRDLLGDPLHHWCEINEDDDLYERRIVEPWPPSYAELRFLRRFHELRRVQ